MVHVARLAVRFSCAAMLVFLTAAAPLAPPTPRVAGADPLNVVKALGVALNAHDEAAVMSLMADGAAVQEDRAPQDRQQIQGWVGELVREDIHVNLVGEPRMTVSTSARAGRLVSWRAELALQPFRAEGLASVGATLAAVVTDNKIAFLRIAPDADWPHTSAR
jgi:hypothetical protein